MHDIGTGLADRGHRVRLVTTAPHGVVQRATVGGMRVTYLRSVLPPRAVRGNLDRQTAFAPWAAAAALLGGDDVAVAYHYGDGYGLAQVRRRRDRPRLVLKLTGTVRPERIGAIPPHDRMLRSAMAAADEVWVNSRFAAAELTAFGVPLEVVPAPLDREVFRPPAGGTGRDDAPTVLVTSASQDPRKRIDDVLAAWSGVVAGCPDARLQIAGAADRATRARLLGRVDRDVHASVSFLGDLDTPELVGRYQRAWAVVVPSVHEALGLVTLEALACGTPVVGADSGATPELLAGVVPPAALFAPGDPDALAGAVTEVLRRVAEVGDGAAAGELRAACRAATARFDAATVLDEVEQRVGALHGGAA